MRHLSSRSTALFTGTALSAATAATVLALFAGGPAAASTAAASTAAASSSTTFTLAVNPAVASCLAKPGSTPTASVTVRRGPLNDTATLTAHGLKPGLDFDVFTVQRSLFDASFPAHNKSFGLAWYQSDLHAGSTGTASTTIKTILLDQIFGFDADTGLAPTNTFHLGFWFNRPTDAAACGFTGSTPFNGEHNAGPVAMISTSNAGGFGPLKTH
jgi:hypothetical protein